MGAGESKEIKYANFIGESKPGESRVLKHSMDILKPTDPQTMLEELE